MNSATTETETLKAICNRWDVPVPVGDLNPVTLSESLCALRREHLEMRAAAKGPDAFARWAMRLDQISICQSDLRDYIQAHRIAAAKSTVHNPSPNSVPSTQHSSLHSPSVSSVSSVPLWLNNSPANQKRSEPEPTPDQNRTTPEPKANQKRTDPEPPRPKSAKTPTNPPISDPENQETPEPSEPTAEKREKPQQNPTLDPSSMPIKAYISAYFDQHGPPTRLRLSKMSAQEQSFLSPLLEEMSLQSLRDKLLMPPPYGLYKLTSKSALRRYRIKRQAADAKRNQVSLRRQIQTILSQPEVPDADYTRVTEQLLKLRLIEASLNPDPDLTQTRALVDMLEKIRSGKLAERKLHLAETKQAAK